MMKNIVAIIITTALLALLPTKSGATVILSGDVAAGTGVLEFTTDYSFDVATGGTAQLLVFDEWATQYDGSQTFSNLTGGFSLLLNGVDTGAAISKAVDNLGQVVNDITALDAYMFWNLGVNVIASDVLTIAAGTWSLAANANWNPQVSGVFSGNMFITDGNGISLTDNAQVAVPEPAALALISLGLLLLRRGRIA